MPLETLLTFSVASALLSLSPGPDNLFVLMQAALHGRRAGILITLGLCTGLLVHTALVAAGVAAIVVASTLAFTALKFVGAAYLVYLAVMAWKAGDGAGAGDGQLRLTGSQLYRRGIIMNLSNPKVAIFFLAFLPQFSDPARGSIALQIMGLGFIFIVIALLVFSAVALLAGRLSTWLAHSRHAGRRLNRMAALVFLALAARLVLSPR